jgi:hypothetical protein
MKSDDPSAGGTAGGSLQQVDAVQQDANLYLERDDSVKSASNITTLKRAPARDRRKFASRPMKVRGHDACFSPPEAMVALMRVERLPPAIWECACGDGALVRPLRAAGHKVYATDLIDYGLDDSQSRIDFLLETKAPPGCDTIISNVPYKLGAEFVRHALALVRHAHFLFRINFVESVDRTNIIGAGTGLRVIRAFRNRLPALHDINHEGNRVSNPFCYAWFSWDREYRGATIFEPITWSKK